MKIPTWEELDELGLAEEELNPLQEMVNNWEPAKGYREQEFREDLQKLVDWLLTQCQCDERED